MCFVLTAGVCSFAFVSDYFTVGKFHYVARNIVNYISFAFIGAQVTRLLSQGRNGRRGINKTSVHNVVYDVTALPLIFAGGDYVHFAFAESHIHRAGNFNYLVQYKMSVLKIVTINAAVVVARRNISFVLHKNSFSP